MSLSVNPRLIRACVADSHDCCCLSMANTRVDDVFEPALVNDTPILWMTTYVCHVPITWANSARMRLKILGVRWSRLAHFMRALVCGRSRRRALALAYALRRTGEHQVSPSWVHAVRFLCLPKECRAMLFSGSCPHFIRGNDARYQLPVVRDSSHHRLSGLYHRQICGVAAWIRRQITGGRFWCLPTAVLD